MIWAVIAISVVLNALLALAHARTAQYFCNKMAKRAKEAQRREEVSARYFEMAVKELPPRQSVLLARAWKQELDSYW